VRSVVENYFELFSGGDFNHGLHGWTQIFRGASVAEEPEIKPQGDGGQGNDGKDGTGRKGPKDGFHGCQYLVARLPEGASFKTCSKVCTLVSCSFSRFFTM